MLHRAHVQPCQFFSCPMSICIFRACIYFSIFAQQCTRLFIVLFANNKGEIITLHVHGSSFPSFISRYVKMIEKQDRLARNFSKKNLINLFTREKLNILSKYDVTKQRLHYVLDTILDYQKLIDTIHYINNYKFVLNPSSFSPLI